MGYYKKHKGDYYRGDYYRGDLWDDILSGVEQFGQAITPPVVASLGKQLFGGFQPDRARTLPAPMDATAPSTTGTALSPALRARLSLPPPVAPTIPAASQSLSLMPRAARAARGGGGGSTHTAFRHVDSWEVRDRRVMNPLNPHALRRAIRRGRSFQRYAMKVLRLEGVHRKVKGFKKKFGGKKKA